MAKVNAPWSSASRRTHQIVWENCTIATGVGRFCDRAVPEGSPLSICGAHLIKAFRFCEDALDIATKDDVPRTSRSDEYLRFRAWEDRHAKPARPTVIYYALIGEVIKIGITTQLKERLITLKADDCLATEPGTWALEEMRHKQFEHLRAPIFRQRELFMPGDDLISHIEMLRRDALETQPTAA